MVGKLDISMKKDHELGFFTQYTQINSKWNIGVNVTAKAIKLKIQETIFVRLD